MPNETCYRPLFFPDDDSLARGRRNLFGWLADQLCLRPTPRAKAVYQQMKDRSARSRDEWRLDGVHGRFARSVMGFLHLSIDWPNDHFVPSDPWSIVTFNYYWDNYFMDGCEIELFYRWLEDLVGQKLSNETVEPLYELTLAEAIDSLFSMAQAVPGLEKRLAKAEKKISK